MVWPDNEDGQYAKNYLMPMILEGTQKYIANANTDISIIKLNQKVIPIMCSEPGIKNCYVCSPYDQYIHYAIHELETIQFKPLELILSVLIRFLGVVFNFTHFNRVVYVNNWLLSTNLYVDLSKNEVDLINQFLSKQFPFHLILYRSLNTYTNQELMNHLTDLGAKRLVSRQVYITDPHNPTYLKKKDFKNDRTHLRKSKLRILDKEITIQHAQDLKIHYDDLYIKKYTDLNPQFTLDFFEWAILHQLFEFKIVEKDGVSKAVLGYFKRNGVMTTPIFGYDTKAPLKEGLYRLISTLLVLDSEKNQMILNQSSGAAKFKSTRGASPYIEYNYYFDYACQPLQKLSWRVLSFLVNTIGEPILKRYQL